MKEYTTYLCTNRICNKEFVLLTEDVQANNKNGRYITCPYCCTRRIKVIKETDSIKECMSAHCYKRDGGALKQIR